jgi:hypothetical protein
VRDGGVVDPDRYQRCRSSDLEEIVVYGIRQSMENSIAQKRASTSQIDVITAEDVTKFPDVNVAESLSRLPGAAAIRRRISRVTPTSGVSWMDRSRTICWQGACRRSCRRKTFSTKWSSLTRRVRYRSAGAIMERGCRWA